MRDGPIFMHPEEIMRRYAGAERLAAKLEGRLATCREAMMRASTALRSMKLSKAGQERVAAWLDEALKGEAKP